VFEKLTIAEIVERLQRLPQTRWVWMTGGEPLDHPIGKLVKALKMEGYEVALATSGIHECGAGWNSWDVNFLSISPHFADARWKQRTGQQINLVPGLNELRLSDFDSDWIQSRFAYYYATPCDGKSETLSECLDWIRTRPKWKLGVQAHKLWNLP
jgi:7-carboxy-7-deazaguanine synthase